MVQPLQKVVWYFSKTVLPYDPAISLLGIYLKKKLIQKDTYTPMLTAALFIIAGCGSNSCVRQ